VGSEERLNDVLELEVIEVEDKVGKAKTKKTKGKRG
jgi:hypothetical protein